MVRPVTCPPPGLRSRGAGGGTRLTVALAARYKRRPPMAVKLQGFRVSTR